MGSTCYISCCLSWKRIMGIFFLPVILSGFASCPKRKDGKVNPSSCRSNWSHLSPLTLKKRSQGLVGKNEHFTLEGQKFLIFGGSIHYFRVPMEYWRDRLLKLKACGFNTVTTYIPWNLHEPERGQFYFSGNLNMEAFVLMAAEVGLWVILRPGPYICAEVDLGGLPSWLLQDPKLKLRTTDKGFVEAVDKYFDHLIPRMIPLQYHHGGPVIAVQVENEYGSFDKDAKYMSYVKEALMKRGIVELLLTSDNEKEIQKGSVKGALTTVNMNSFKESFFISFRQMQNKPILIMEYWIGWFDSWGKKHHFKTVNEVEQTVSELINHEISFNIYMFHGGTNFGFINGAVYFGKHIGVVTSYDYDAVLTEAGDYTEKYFKLRKLFASLSAKPLPLLPQHTSKTVYPSVRPSFFLPLWEVLRYLNEPVKSHIPVNMENLPINNGSGQSFGFVLYETSICSGGHLQARVHDFGQVFLNDTVLGVLNENVKELYIPEFTKCQLLRILVENQGRVNFSWKIQDERKGLIGPVRINNISLEGFTIYSLEMKTSFFQRLRFANWRPVTVRYLGPAFYQGTLKADSSPRDTFLRLPGWVSGFVFINGRNLGRYWNIGPQETLYLPGVWLHPGNNEIILFEKITSGSHIYSTDFPKL
ncbi:beta-galactosidase-1-like protein 3 isoform X2 [Sciurus carolinensis]|uniref:beta-galactosidase-1-like protein 3 isoform X2 n=1 Tax=Sciurus carolinensis TaxID=30640 RepID=UPI001FB247FD|nr:beta-galactosidase-1-like protein 3 isoform X2 [Sciurus carolinensis]